MVTIARGWWSALEPTLLAFTVVVCGSVSLPSNAHAAVLDGSHLRGTTASDYWTAAATERDSLDGGDEFADAFLAAPIILTSDDGFGRALVETDFGAVSTLRPERPAPRGPPHRTHPACTQENFEREQDSDVIVDDDDYDDDEDYDDDDDGRDDGGATDLGCAPHTVIRGSSSTLILSGFDALCSFDSDGQSLRAPPL
jgi:hypothetical protein